MIRPRSGNRVLQHRAVRYRHLQGADPLHRGLQARECRGVLGGQRGDLRREPRRRPGLVRDDQPAGLAHRLRGSSRHPAAPACADRRPPPRFPPPPASPPRPAPRAPARPARPPSHRCPAASHRQDRAGSCSPPPAPVPCAPSAGCDSKEMTGLLSRIAVLISPFMSYGVDGRNIFKPGDVHEHRIRRLRVLRRDLAAAADGGAKQDREVTWPPNM